MKLNLLILNRKTAGNLADFIARQIGAHLESWADGMKHCTYALNWTKGGLILQTDSALLVELFQKYERFYVEHLLTEEMPVEKNIALFLDAA